MSQSDPNEMEEGQLVKHVKGVVYMAVTILGSFSTQTWTHFLIHFQIYLYKFF